MAGRHLETHLLWLSHFDSVFRYSNLGSQVEGSQIAPEHHVLESSMTPVSYVDIHLPRASGPAVWVVGRASFACF